MLSKKNTVQLLFLLCVCVLQAQVQSNPPMRQVLASTGGTNVLTSGISIEYTVGECMVSTYASSSPFLVKVLTQGFQQPLTASDTTKTSSPLKFYSGFTPNDDGDNDNWKIDGITKFPDNMVTIFNRWGNKIWDGKNYDNTKVVWDGKSDTGGFLPDATYFYVIEADGKLYRGWVELTK